MKPTYVLEESSGFVVPVVTVTLDSGSVFAPGGGKETCVVGVAANGGGHKIKNRDRNKYHVTSLHSVLLDHDIIEIYST